MWTKVLGVNWKTNLTGIVNATISAPILIQALQDKGAGKPVNWPLVLIGVFTAVNAAGFFSAKDKNVTGGNTLNSNAAADTPTAPKE